MKSKISAYIALMASVALFMVSCTGGHTYNDCHNVDESGWNKDSIVTFTPAITDTITKFDILVTVRHTSSYQYQNFWMFVNVTSPEGLVAKDTIECYLADNRGRFLGSGISVYEMPVLISQNIRLEKSGEYKFEVIQGMRDENLTGVRNICLTIDKHK